MKIIPAIDLLDNEAVRLFKGDYSQKTVYSKEPWGLVKGFEKNGAELIHLVDLNGARNASTINQDCILKIRNIAPSVNIQLGGGIRDMDRLKYYHGIGINRFIIGTSAVTNPKFVEDALAFSGPEKIVVSVDAKDGIVRIKGWEETTKLHYADFLKRLESQGVKQIVFTDISQDGTLSGPNLDSYRDILDNFPFDLIASGGISSMKDILDLSLIKAKTPIFGVITGKAIYEGRLNLEEAINHSNKLK
ncbi:MAG: 1-(5-phosphoribosyl)-5-[(5-phosphoribosylamino)methylideneamino]imidazole-4-carboxamide isomerase [Leptospiraceae bacterium]|nr:1-(5-phosphoribosyl)-5-[(5-phosphoribosylamino)methylideneamino]imidazole-4-carboxamide isomerase [Leptospiraceae bacterium]